MTRRGGAGVVAVARVALLRLVRGRASWLVALVAAVPLPFAAWLHARADAMASAFEVVKLLVAIVPAWLVAAALGDELDHATYTWARPLPRWTVVVGKLVALSPIAVVAIGASWCGCAAVAAGRLPSGASIAALAAVTVAMSCAAAGIAVLAPRFAMALAIVYALFDLLIGELPVSLRLASMTGSATRLAEMTGEGSVGWAAARLAGVAVVWLAVALVRVRRREA
jgi:hypothetical protein